MVNGVSMDNVEHAFAVQQLRKSGKNAKIVSVFTSDFIKVPAVLLICFWCLISFLPFKKIKSGTVVQG